MRKYGTNDEVVKAFFNINELGPSSNSKGSIYWHNKNTLYSYGSHFPLAISISCDTYLLNGDSYSPTTNKHQSLTRRYCPNGFTTSISMLRRITENINEFKGKKWEKTGHNLDFIFERDGVYYGCEIKNSLSYIEREELDTKIEMCEFFKIIPLFIMRFAPKSYNNEIIRKGGFALIFKYQFYEMSQINLVRRIKEVLELPVDCPRAVEEGTIKRFEDWHKRKKDVNLKKIHNK